MSSVTLVHPAEAVGRNEMPFGRDTIVVPSNSVLDRAPVSPREGEIWGRGRTPVGSDVAYCPIALAVVNCYCYLLLFILLLVGNYCQSIGRLKQLSK